MSHQPRKWNIRHWWSGNQKEYKIYHKSCLDIGLWKNRYSQLCRKIQGKIRMNESHTRRKRPPLMTSSPASSPSLMSLTIQSTRHRSQRREDPRDEHARRLDPPHRLCIEGGCQAWTHAHWFSKYLSHGGWRARAAPISHQQFLRFSSKLPTESDQNRGRLYWHGHIHLESASDRSKFIGYGRI